MNTQDPLWPESALQFAQCGHALYLVRLAQQKGGEKAPGSLTGTEEGFSVTETGNAGAAKKKEERKKERKA